MLRPTAIQVTQLKNYCLKIIFDNSEIKQFDVKSYIRGEWYGELNDPDYFNSANVDGFTVMWPHGQDICPDELYDSSTAL